MRLISSLLGNAGTVNQEDIDKECDMLLVEGEDIYIVFKIFRDLFIFTNKRLILIDKQGGYG